MTTSIGFRMQKAREAAGLTLDEVAEALGVVPRTVASWEHDLGSPRVDQAMQICTTIRITPSMLILGKERT